MSCGNAFLLYDDEASDSIPHLHIVISDPNENGLVVLASITTERTRSDLMTRVAPGSHPFVLQPSVVAYQYSKVIACDRLREMVEAGEAILKPDATDALVARIQSGMTETMRAPREVQDCFKAWLRGRGR